MKVWVDLNSLWRYLSTGMVYGENLYLFNFSFLLHAWKMYSDTKQACIRDRTIPQVQHFQQIFQQAVLCCNKEVMPRCCCDKRLRSLPPTSISWQVCSLLPTSFLEVSSSKQWIRKSSSKCENDKCCFCSCCLSSPLRLLVMKPTGHL